VLHQEADRANITPELALAVIHIESRFDRYAISSAGAQGYMQIMPFWLREIAGPEENLFHTRTNLRMGCTILRYYLDRSKGDLVKALARYNGSAGKPQYPALVIGVLNKRYYRG
jgi:soluble lytic murein transglycosylase-like protein